MKFLAWDTSSKSGAIVAFESGDSENFRLIAELVLNVDSTHSERLLWGIHQVLESARWKLREVDCFGVGIGPGSFTGLRIGITTARTLSHTLEKPLIGVSSLAALARPATHFASHDTLIVAATDACKGELFALWGSAKEVAKCVIFPQDKDPGLWSPEVQEQVVEPALLMQKLSNHLGKMGPNAKWIAVGEGRDRYLEEWSKGIPVDRELKSDSSCFNSVQARTLGGLVWEGFKAGAMTKGIDLSPRYLRLSNAELKLKNHLGPLQST